MNQELLSAILPPSLLDNFELVSFNEVTNESTGLLELEIHLDEKNDIHNSEKEKYRSQGFLPVSRIQDFPIRGKAVYLLIRRRRWRHIQSGSDYTNDHSIVAEGSRITQDLSDFLKDTGRD